jgi:hypothetical protein
MIMSKIAELEKINKGETVEEDLAEAPSQTDVANSNSATAQSESKSNVANIKELTTKLETLATVGESPEEKINAIY